MSSGERLVVVQFLIVSLEVLSGCGAEVVVDTLLTSSL